MLECFPTTPILFGANLAVAGMRQERCNKDAMRVLLIVHARLDKSSRH